MLFESQEAKRKRSILKLRDKELPWLWAIKQSWRFNEEIIVSRDYQALHAILIAESQPHQHLFIHHVVHNETEVVREIHPEKKEGSKRRWGYGVDYISEPGSYADILNIVYREDYRITIFPSPKEKATRNEVYRGLRWNLHVAYLACHEIDRIRTPYDPW